MRIPGATYRVQLNQDFPFEQARALLPYLQAIGITDLYASPVFQARAGSLHGYDITDPSRINSELGTPEQFDALVNDLRARNMGLLLDIVPNHMAANSANPWWMDVLENGSASQYAAYFDIEWGHETPSVQDKILIPVLGELYGDALEHRKLQLSLDESGFNVSYYEKKFPIDPGTYHDILAYRLPDLLAKASNGAVTEFGLVLERSERMPARSATDWEELEARRREQHDLKAKVWQVYTEFDLIRDHLDENIRRFNGTEGDPASFDMLDELLNRQAYQLMYYQVARERINYRRFFDVSDLIALRTQDPQVFEATHALVLCWLQQGKITGLRIDHIDGLYDPLAYLAQLQEKTSERARGTVYITVEKILSCDEKLPVDWPVGGTTGYDFLGPLNNLFVHADGLKALDTSYTQFIGTQTSHAETAYVQKKKVMVDLFAVEMHTLALHLARLAEQHRHSRDLSPEELREALIEVTASLPIYRTYTRDARVASRDRAFIEDALRNARQRNPSIGEATLEFVRKVLCLELSNSEDVLRFTMRWQQLTGPIMAKGVEDTTLYLYNRLISMNEVGGSPVPVSLEQFHEFNTERRTQWPGTMNASSTHDTKRSEDVRARLNLLSEMPAEWQRYVNRWHRWNRDKFVIFNGQPVPGPNEEYLLYQTLLGAWPLENGIAEFRERIKRYMVKAVREGKTHTNWLTPNQEYEAGLSAFVDSVLDGSGSNRFLEHFRKFQRRIAFYGAVNSLSQTLLKMTCPGVPDFYQGTTLWDFSLVDPDNRRPVELPSRLELLGGFKQFQGEDLLDSWPDGRVKSFLIYKTLQYRNANSNLFLMGEYVELNGTGLAAEHTVAYARKRGDEWAVVVVPRFVTRLTALEKWPIGRRFWKDDAILLPGDAPVSWKNVLTGEHIASDGPSLSLAELLKSFPVALITGQL